MRLAGFFDDNLHMQGRRVDGVAVWGAQNLGYVLRSNAVDDVILALPRVNRARRAEIVSMLERHSAHVRTVHDLSRLMKWQVPVKDAPQVKVEDLHRREPVEPDRHLQSLSITGQSALKACPIG